MASYSLFIDDYLAEASPVLGRMRLDGLTETTVPFAERLVLLWRRGAPTPDMNVDDLVNVLKVRPASCFVLMRCASRSAGSSLLASAPRTEGTLCTVCKQPERSAGRTKQGY